MTYSNTWSTTRPLGSAQASTADDEIRALRLDIQERMNSIVVDWTLDLVELNQALIGSKEGKKLIVHGTAFIIEPSESESFNYDDVGTTNVSNIAQPMRAWVPLPNGVTITNIRWIVTNGDTGAVPLSFGSLSFSEALTTEILSALNSTVAGTAIIDSGPISIPISADKTYFLKADKGGGAPFGVHAVEITYNTPDSRNTI